MSALYTYESVSALADEITGREHVVLRGLESERWPSDRWDLSAGFDGAMVMAREGWSDVRADVTEMSAQFDAEVNAVDLMPAPLWDVSGSFVDVGAYLSGQPECMVTFTDVEVPRRRTVRMIWNVCASADTSAPTLLKRGAAACALVEVLERSGLSVELVVAIAESGAMPRDPHGGDWSPVGRVRSVNLACTVKRSGDPFDVDRFMFAAAHPAFLRRLYFAWCERVMTGTEWREIGTRNYGYPCRADVPGGFDIGQADPIHVSDEISADPVGWIRGQLARLGDR